ncbi:LacI family transcriptional regulator [Ereboglobus sp. PH5-10]|uniref:LacI family DNA-binding transcriptional regulator n=1 Tax=Ereboglobus sp. PH5-10 TaxID=2940629 RepID=UPI002405471F|nr:LacI family DNA-binding transcriptional regulator [Ereboglobus sp. PH5-10]MDF9825964.1 LacI family transcriptional regulator [Ereboglobus sp. PH5-10]
MSKLIKVTLTDVAKAAGLSIGGTSYALRGHPNISRATVERVRKVAAELGYKPDLRIKSLMANIRRGRRLEKGETLALVWINTPRELSGLATATREFAKNILLGVTRRAEQHGCALDQFRLFGDGLSPARLWKILVSRGISGVIFAPMDCRGSIALDWDWSPFATAVIGHTEFTPSISRSAHFHYRSVWRVLERLGREGHTRPAIILNQEVQERIHFMQTAAFITNHPNPKDAMKCVAYGTPKDFSPMEKWLRKTKPDVLIMAWQIDRQAVELIRRISPKTRKIITLEWHPQGVLSGVNLRNDELAANAVDMVVAQMHANNLGVPECPVSMLMDGIWKDAP